MLIAINDTCEFLQVNLIEFIRYLDEHSSWSDELWEKLNANADVYNRSIIGDYGKRNICANTISSFSLKYTSDTLYTVLGLVSNYNNNILLCDYGCCNANITISMLLNGKTSYLAMHDYHTESTNLIEYRLNKHKMQANAQWHDINDTADKFLYDVVYCTDVLEHTTNPSEILMNKLYLMIKPGGYLILQAPWGGDNKTHLDEAIVDFYGHSGRQFLKKNFKIIYSMTHLDISGVWRKNT